MLKRKFYDTLTSWRKRHGTEGLLVKGARQIGKKITLPHYMSMFL